MFESVEICYFTEYMMLEFVLLDENRQAFL